MGVPRKEHPAHDNEESDGAGFLRTGVVVRFRTVHLKIATNTKNAITMRIKNLCKSGIHVSPVQLLGAKCRN